LLALHTPPEHAACGKGQQSCSGPPHATQVLAVQYAPRLHAVPDVQHV
jgi:hypothetical protein